MPHYSYFGPYLNHIAAFQIQTDLRNQFYRKIDPLAPAIFISRRTGDLVSIAINNIEVLELFFAHTLTQIIVAVIMPLIVLCALGWIHLYLTLILLFSISLPDGYDTLVCERGIRLSGGERQWVAIAREILKNAPVLIMDEATSNLDTGTELLARNTIQELMKGRTVCMITHRLSTVVHTDKILVLNHGEIIEQGTHRELIQRGGMYADLIVAQEI